MGKTSKQTSEINPAVARAAAENYAKAQDVARLGYQPNRGVTIAAFTPQQEAAMRGANTAATAFGMPGTAGDPLAHMPAAETSASGVRGYSTGADYDQMMNRLPAGYRRNLNSFFVNPNQVLTPTKPNYATVGGGGGKK